MTDQAALTDTIQQYLAASSGLTSGSKRAFWDENEPLPVLSPEEIPEPLIGWEALTAYWGKLGGAIKEIESRPRALRFDLLDPDLGWRSLPEGTEVRATYAMRWILTMNNAEALAPGPIGGDVRVTSFWRLKGETWKLFCLFEAPAGLPLAARLADEFAAS